MSTAFQEFLYNLPSKTVILTFACSIDGIIGKKKQILQLSSPESLIMTHTIRNSVDGILVGIGTVLNDNPSLTTRIVKDPVDSRVVVVDPDLKCPLDAKFITRKPVFLVSLDCEEERIVEFTKLGATVVKISFVAGSCSRLDLNEGMTELRKLGLKRIMIEGKSPPKKRWCRDYQRMFERKGKD
jgi:riboflavin-specific deaminase-like protein